MPGRYRRSAVRRSGRSRRRTQWVDFEGDITALPIGDFFNTDLLGNYRIMPGAETAGITLMRHHLYIWVTSAVVTGDGIAFGTAVDDQAEAITATALGTAHAWNPIDQPYLSWTMFRRFNAHPTYSFIGSTNNLEFDIRSRRKIPFGDTLLLSVANVDASAAVSFAIHSRALIALS